MSFYSNLILNSIKEGSIYKSDGFNIMVQPDQTRIDSYKIDPYFKVYNSNNYNKADKVARISIIDPHYVYHSYNEGKKNWILNSSERKKLNNILHSFVGDISIYEILLTEAARCCSVEKLDINPIEIPDFSSIRK